MDNYLTHIEPLTNWLNQHPHWAGIFTFLISFSESLAIVGSIVPGSITMTAIGVLIGTGVIPAVPTFAWALLGAIAGDSASYYLGYYYRDKINEYWPFRKYPHIIESGKVFFNQHGGKSVFLGRFLGPLRSIIPMIAGMMHMPNAKFLSANITSAFLWSLMYIMPGVFVGAAATELSPHLASQLFIYTLIIVSGLWLFTWVSKYFFFTIQRFITNHLKEFWLWMNRHPTLNAWAKVISNPKHPQDHKQIVLLFFALLFGACFILVAFSALHKGLITFYDKPTFYFLQSIRVPIFDSIFMFFTFIGDKKTLIPILFGIFGYLVYKKHKWEAVHWLSNGIVSALLVYVLKAFINLPRPEGLVQIRHGASFPSGHTTFSVAIYGFLFYLITKNIPASMRRFAVVPGIMLVSCIGFSRLYLGMHWLSDVVGSALIAGSVLMLHILSYRRMEQHQLKVKPLIAWSCLIALSINSALMYKNFNSAIQGSQLKHTISSSELTQWWEHKLNLPKYRTNRIGLEVSPLNIQWAMPLAKIEAHLVQFGWQVNDRDTLSARFKTLLQPQQTRLSLFRKLYHNKPPKLLMTKKNMLIRLWHSEIQFKHQRTPLWVGTISYVAQEHSGISNSKIVRQRRIQDNYLPSNILVKELQGLSFKTYTSKAPKEIILIK